MTNSERAARYCALIGRAQERMERGAAMAFDRHHPQQRDACRRMVRYIALIRWLYRRALARDRATAEAFRASLLGERWPYGGIDRGDIGYFTLIGTYGFVDVADDVEATG